MDLGKCIDIKMNVTEAHRRAYKLIKFDSMFRNRKKTEEKNNSNQSN